MERRRARALRRAAARGGRRAPCSAARRSAPPAQRCSPSAGSASCPAPPGSSLAAAARISAFLLPAALAEELVSRGYLLTAIRDGVGAWIAAAVTSLLFGLAHLVNPGVTVESFVNVTLAGLFLAAVRIVFDSLYAAWAAHAAWNWIMAVPFHAAVSGISFDAPDYRTISHGPAWATGGTWGPEGGVAAAVGMLAGLLLPLPSAASPRGVVTT